MPDRRRHRSCLRGGVCTAGRGAPGHDTDIITDGAITSAIVAHWPWTDAERPQTDPDFVPIPPHGPDDIPSSTTPCRSVNAQRDRPHRTARGTGVAQVLPQTKDPKKLLEAFEYFCQHLRLHQAPRARAHQVRPVTSRQEQSVDLWIRNRYSLMLKARQLGFSTLVTVYAFWLTFFYPDRVVIMLSSAPSATPSSCWPRRSTPTASCPSG